MQQERPIVLLNEEETQGLRKQKTPAEAVAYLRRLGFIVSDDIPPVPEGDWVFNIPIKREGTDGLEVGEVQWVPPDRS